MFYINDDLESIDRYGLQKLIEYSNPGDFSTLSSVFLTEMRELPIQSYITAKEERPDLLAYKIYGDTKINFDLFVYENSIEFKLDYNNVTTEKVMIYNDCIDFTDGTFAAGAQIKYPRLEDLEKLIFTLKARKRAQEAELGEL
mgnify:CR=1 FL=1